MSALDESLERLRQLWTPERDVVQLDGDLAPRTPLDSIVRDFLHRAIEQRGPLTLTLERDGEHVLNTGTLRWEIAGIPGYREVSIWIEREER